MSGQTPSDEKVSMEFQMSWKFFVKEIFFYPIWFGQALYIGVLG